MRLRRYRNLLGCILLSRSLALAKDELSKVAVAAGGRGDVA